MADHYKGHRLGSRKATVRREYDENGATAAIAKGAELGLAGGTVKSWIGGWKKVAIPTKMAGVVNPKHPTKLDKVLSTTRRPIFLKGHPDWKGVVVEAGPEQSLVRWANGNQVIACNSWLEDDNKSRNPLN